MKFAIAREHRSGRTWYLSREVGMVTTLVRNMWTTGDRAAADRLCAEVGGWVVTL